MGKKEDLTDRRFGRLTVLEYAGRKGKRRQWLCKCDCGNEIIVLGESLKSGNTSSCGCLRKDVTRERRRTHGLRYDPLYTVWCGMKQRCNYENHKNYHHYGGRGISICAEWENAENFYNDMIEGYAPGLSLDRIDVNGDYEPGNCRWVDWTTQGNNRTNSRVVEYNGVSHTISEWSRLLGVKYITLYHRVNNNDLSDFERYFQDKES